MTTIQGPWVLDDPDGTSPDPIAELMEYARATVAESEAARNATLARRTTAALDEALPIVSRILEDAGLDIFTTEPRAIVSAIDPNIGVIHTEHGLRFEIRPGRNSIGRHTLAGTHNLWLLHPETGARIGRVGEQTTWAHIAEMIVEHDNEPADALDDQPVEQSPAEQMADALAEFVRSITAQPEQGGF